MDLITLLNSMNPVILFLISILFLILFLFGVRAVWLSFKMKRASSNHYVKDIYISQSEIKPSLTLSKIQTGHASKEKRNNPRYNFEQNIEFVQGGKLFKEVSKDLSHTGIFLKTTAPDSYDTGTEVILTFRTPNEGPQKRTGRIVRKDKNGIGIHFLS